MGAIATALLLWKVDQFDSDGAFTSCSRPVFTRSASPEWTTIVVDGFTVTIPYSSLWDVENAQCLRDGAQYDPAVYQVTAVQGSGDATWFELAFGRPANNLTSIDREYHLVRRETTDRDADLMPDSWSCVADDIPTPVEMTFGDTTGWRYFRGGAKWCQIVFQFTEEGMTYTLERNLEPKADAHVSDTELAAIDEEMQRIIESIDATK